MVHYEPIMARSLDAGEKVVHSSTQIHVFTLYERGILAVNKVCSVEDFPPPFIRLEMFHNKSV